MKNSKIVSYPNFFLNKKKIYKENKGKSGVYCLNNLITNKSYVGCSRFLSRRFAFYYSNKSMKNKLNKGKSAICSALLKYGSKNFSLDILEYSNVNILLREQYYMDKLKPEYNIKIPRKKKTEY